MRLFVCTVCALLLAHAASAAEFSPASRAAVQKSDKSFVRGGPLPGWAQPLAEVQPTSRRDPLVFRLREAQSLVGAAPATLINLALQANDASALAAIGQYGISYHPSYQKLVLHRVAILRGGEVLDRLGRANIRVLQQEQQLRNGVYEGASTIQLLLDDVRVGDTLWITYSTVGANPVFGKRWSDQYSWDMPVPVELRRVTVLHPRQRPLHWRQLGDFNREAIKPVVDQVGELERIRFEDKALAGVEPEPATPPDFQFLRMLQASEYDSWQEVAAWAAGLFPPVTPTPALQQLAHQFAQAPDKAAQAAAALHWVQDEVRYFSVSIGENSHRPQAPDLVLRRRFGDCKDKAYLLVSLLSQLGIPARPMLVNAVAPAVPGKVIPSPDWFDHVVVGLELDGRTIYVDPTRTGQKGPLDKLPPVLPGALALPTDAAAVALVKLPDRDDGLPQVEHVDRIVIESFDGDAILESHDIYRGESADGLRTRVPSMSAGELKRGVMAPYEKTYTGLSLVGDPLTMDRAAQGEFEIVARFKLPKPLEHEDGRYRLAYTSQVMEGTLGIPNNLTRQFPFAYPHGKYAGRYRLQVVWPKDVRHLGEIQAKTIDNAFLRLQEEYAFRGNYVDYVLDYRLKSDRIAAADLPGLQQQSRQLNPFVEASFRVAQVAIADKEQGLSLRDIDVARSMQTLYEWVNRGDKGKVAKLDDDDNCTVLRDVEVLRVIDIPDGGRLADELLDAIQRDNHPGTGACVGEVLLARGDFKGAVAAFERAKLPDTDPGRASLAWSRLHARDAKGAAADMLRFVRAREASGDLNPLDIADASALLARAGEPIPPGLAARARDLPDGPWPRPLLALQSGALEPQALLARAEALPGDARELALDDAWFFIGEQRLAAGDRRGARVAFAQVEAHAVIGTQVHGRALAELAALGSDDPDTLAGVALDRQHDFKGAATAWTRAAQRGDAEAQYRLGIAYHYGLGVKEDKPVAAHWFDLAARQDYPDACTMVGYYFDEGEGGRPEDHKAANEWYRRGAELGDGTAALNLGRHYSDGVGIAVDRAAGLRYLLQAAERNEVKAQALLVWRYADGDGVPRDDRAAAYWAERASARGNEAAAVDFGRFMWDGRGVGKNPELGTRFIREAAGRGNVKAWYFMGEAYSSGRGVARDPKEAVKWFEKAARADHPFAKLQMGLAYLLGTGVAQDKNLAVRWLEGAAADGEAQADVVLGGVYARGDGRPVDLWRAAGYYRKAAEAGQHEGQWRYAVMLRDGKGVPADPVQAAALMQKAADALVLQAQTELARMYQAGIGVERDDIKARTHYRNAARRGDCEAMDGLAGMYESGKGVRMDLRMAQVFYALAVLEKDTTTVCPGAAAKAEKMGGRIDAATLASAQASAAAWKEGELLPDEKEEKEATAKPR